MCRLILRISSRAGCPEIHRRNLRVAVFFSASPLLRGYCRKIGDEQGLGQPRAGILATMWSNKGRGEPRRQEGIFRAGIRFASLGEWFDPGKNSTPSQGNAGNGGPDEKKR